MNQQREYTQEELADLQNKSSQFHEALFGKSIGENKIAEILSITTNEERQIIHGFYKKAYNHPIQNDINTQLTGKLREITTDMFYTPYEYDARELYKSLNSFTNDDNTIVEIFASRPKNYLEIVDFPYQKVFKISLRDNVKKQGSKKYAQFLLILMDIERPMDQTISGSEAYDTAKELIKNGLKIYGSDINLLKKFLWKNQEKI